MDKVSIIVPIYNVEKYLKKCLDSAINQTYKNIEVIAVNDGTKDNSQDIVDEYVIKYPNIVKSYIKENGGLSDARNFGIEKSTGKYIFLLDSDDFIETDTIELLYSKILEQDFDIVICDCKYIYPNSEKIVSSYLERDLLTKQEIKDNMNSIYPVAWNKLYKKSIFDNIKFTKGIWFEDVEFVFRMYPYLNKIGVVKKALYNYLQRENSITYTYNSKLDDFILNWNSLVEYYKKNNLYDEYIDELEYSYVRYAFATYIKRLAKCKNKKVFMQGVEFAINNVNNNFPKYKNNKYLQNNNFKNLYLKSFGKQIAKLVFIIEKNRFN